jgi:sugar phosphate isomerase/epimerase
VDVSLYLSATGSRFWTASTALTLSDAIGRAASLGYDAVEVMPRDVDDPDPDTLRRAAAQYGLSIRVLASGFIAIERGLTFTHPDAGVRHRAVAAMRQCLEAARRARAPLVSIGVIRGTLQAGMDRADALVHLADCIRESATYAWEIGETLVLEPGNRYETDFIHTVDEALELLAEVNLPSVRLMLDTFHMNIEEVSITAAIHRAGPNLAHVHFADSNRRAPGWGHLDFRGVAAALRRIGYTGTVGLEMSLVPDFEAAARQGVLFVRRLFPRTPHAQH